MDGTDLGGEKRSWGVGTGTGGRNVAASPAPSRVNKYVVPKTIKLVDKRLQCTFSTSSRAGTRRPTYLLTNLLTYLLTDRLTD